MSDEVLIFLEGSLKDFYSHRSLNCHARGSNVKVDTWRTTERVAEQEVAVI